MATNYFAPVAGTLAVSRMLERRRGVVVNVSSDSGRAPAPHEAAYSASKAALSAFTESLSFDTEGRGVQLHVLYPGLVPTAIGNEAVDAGIPMPPRMVRRSASQVSQLLLARLGGPKLDIDAAPVARLAPVGRALFPSGIARASASRAGDPVAAPGPVLFRRPAAGGHGDRLTAQHDGSPARFIRTTRRGRGLFPTSSSRPRRSPQNPASVQWAEPVTGSSGMPRWARTPG